MPILLVFQRALTITGMTGAACSELKDYHDIGKQVRKVAPNNGGGYFAILEGGYNHQVLGYNVLSLILGMSGN